MEAHRMQTRSASDASLSLVSSGDLGVLMLPSEVRRGAENNVYFGRDEVSRILHWFGRFWQHPDAASFRDQIGKIRAVGTPLVPVDLNPNTIVEYADGTRRQVDRVVDQHRFSGSPLTSLNFFRERSMADQLHAFALCREELRRRSGLVLDLIGGQAIAGLADALKPWRNEVDFEIANLLIADSRQTAHRDWELCGIEEGETIAEKGQVLLCDPGVYDYRRRGRPVKDGVARLGMTLLENAQDVVLWRILGELGYKSKCDLQGNATRRLVGRIMDVALPKMRRAAEVD